MKIDYFFKELLLFFVVFGFFIFPSIIQSSVPDGAFSLYQFRFDRLILLFCTFLFVKFELESLSLKSFLFPKISLSSFFKKVLFFFIGLVILLCIESFLNFFSSFILQKNEKQVEVLFPKDFKNWFLCVFNFFIGAIIEENIFRFYLPSVFYKIFYKISFTKMRIFLSEVFPCVLFALCHRYLGLVAVINAFCAHSVFRFLFYKSKSPVVPYLVHFFYNMLNVFFQTMF